MTSTSKSSKVKDPHMAMDTDTPVITTVPTNVWETVLQEMPAAQEADIHLHGNFPSQKQVRVIFSQQAWHQVAVHAQSDLAREVGGALLGRVVRHQAQTFVEVLVAMPATSTDHGPIHFTFTADTWASINKEREKQHPNLDIVGWFHTHPDLGVFYSSDDVVVHSAAFTLPWHVGLVVDPIRQEICFFGWEETGQAPEILPINGFYEWLDKHPNPIIEWEVTHYEQWANLPESVVNKMMAAETFSTFPPINPWVGAILGGMSLLISLGLLIERLVNG